MKKILYFISTVLLFLSISFLNSCSQEDEILDPENFAEAKAMINQTIDSLIFECDSIIPIVVNPDSIKSRLFEKLYGIRQENQPEKLSVQTRASYVSSMDDRDDNFWTNMYAIRELPVTLQARSGANTANRFLSTNGKGKDITLVGAATNNRQKFYFKILPASSGIPYLIYSQQERTPVSVGQYKNNPKNKILYVRPDDKGSLYSAGWDLIPSAYGYSGYYAIQSESYIGQSDPNNMWSIFYHVIEVKNDNKTGYAQYSKKGQQEFLIKPDAKFSLYDVEFDQQSAVITERVNPYKIVTTAKNTSWNPAAVDIIINQNLSENSTFQQKKTVALDLSHPNFLYPRPTVVAGRIVYPTSTTKKDAPYAANTTQKISKKIYYKDKIDAPERCLIEHSTFIKTYDIKVNFTAKARYTVVRGDVREAKFSGTWTGVVYMSPEVSKPVTTQRFFNLDTNEEIIVLRRSARK